MRRIGIIINPNAKKNNKIENRKDRFSKIVGDNGIVYQTDKMDEIDLTCRKLIKQNVALVGICGGDGTNHLVSTSLIKEYQNAGVDLPPIHLLEGGSMNTIRWNLGIRGAAEETLSGIIEKLRSEDKFETINVAILKVNEFYGFIFGNGYASYFLEEYYNSNIDSGPARAAQIVGRFIWSAIMRGKLVKKVLSQYKAEFLIDQKPAGLESYGLVLAGTLPAIGLMFKPLYRANESLDHFHLIASSFKAIQLVKQVNKLFSGKKLKGENHIDTLASEVIICTAEPLIYQLDGELYKEKEVKISMGPVLEMVLR